MKVNAHNAAAIRKKAEAEKPFVLHKKGEHRHRWNAWNPNMKAMMTQEVIIELWEECSAAPRADGMVEVTTLNRRLEWELEQLHYQQPRKCSRGRKTLGVVASYQVDAELWAAFLAEHTETEDTEAKAREEAK